MKAHVYVTLKRTVLDAQGQTVADALRRMDYRGIADVRQGKYFLLTLQDGTDAGRCDGSAREFRLLGKPSCGYLRTPCPK